MHEDAPPLKVWVYPVSAIVSLLLLFFSFTYSGFGPYAKTVERSKKKLEEALIEIKKDTSAISIVIVGSSLTEDALVDPAVIEEGIFKLTNKKAKVLRVAIYFMNMDLARRIDFFGYIRKYPPQYLFLENFGMNLDDGNLKELIPTPIDASLLYLRNVVRNKIGLNSNEDYYIKWHTFDTKPLPESGFYSDGFDSLTYKSLQTKKMVVRHASQNAMANEAYEALQKKNTKIVFLDMPQSDKLQRNFLDKNAATEFNKVLEQYRQQYNVEYWPYTGSMSDSCYIDGIHLNYKGAMKYQEWFVSEFALKR
jgi:hypothetical protein